MPDKTGASCGYEKNSDDCQLINITKKTVAHKNIELGNPVITANNRQKFE